MSAPADHIDYGERLPLPGTGPMPGDTYRNIHRDTIATVLRINRRKQTWYVIRSHDSERELSHRELVSNWMPCRPDGSLR